jgi:hypothetical protein
MVRFRRRRHWRTPGMVAAQEEQASSAVEDGAQISNIALRASIIMPREKGLGDLPGRKRSLSEKKS